MVSKAIIYYTDNNIDGTEINDRCRSLLLASGIPIICISHKPMLFGAKNIVFVGRRSKQSILLQAMLGALACNADQVFLCEHDCYYPPDYFQFNDSAGLTYNTNVYRLFDHTYYKRPDKLFVLSQLAGNRLDIIAAIKRKLNQSNRLKCIEPGRSDQVKVKFRSNPTPSIDVRHSNNATKWNPKEFPVESKLDSIAFWDDLFGD
ncbi:MAG: hypothetical protein JEZ07_06530 [Phycisphaerae bacterium]|nr:hypothetical protein [Phycisphaerae bacterium]